MAEKAFPTAQSNAVLGEYLRDRKIPPALKYPFTLDHTVHRDGNVENHQEKSKWILCIKFVCSCFKSIVARYSRSGANRCMRRSCTGCGHSEPIKVKLSQAQRSSTVGNTALSPLGRS